MKNERERGWQSERERERDWHYLTVLPYQAQRTGVCLVGSQMQMQMPLPLPYLARTRGTSRLPQIAIASNWVSNLLYKVLYACVNRISAQLMALEEFTGLI